jgi:hypothetical protein
MENHPIYSAEITEIIGTPPRWIMRAGGGVLLLLLLGFVGLSASISIPEQTALRLRLNGTIQPYFLRQGPTSAQPVVAAGQLVRQGQLLLHHPLDPAADERAPFTGTVFYEDLARPARRAGDTLGLLAPLTNTYRFSGRISVGRIRELQTHAANLQVEVPLNDQADGSLLLNGRLSYINPVVHQGTVTYHGQLDSLSSVALARHFTAITTLEGALLLRQHSRPILRRLLNY